MLISMATELLAELAVIVLILQNAGGIPAALTELLNACKPLAHAAYELAATLRTSTGTGTGTGTNDPRPLDHDQGHTESSSE